MNALKPQAKLTYFPVAGRAEFVKLTLEVAEIPYEFESVEFDNWESVSQDRSRFPQATVPVMEAGNVKLCDSYACQKYASQLGHLVPEDPFAYAKAEEIRVLGEGVYSGTDRDINIMGVVYLPMGSERAEAMKKLQVVVHFYYRQIEELLNNDGYAVCDQLTYVDILVFCYIAHLRSESNFPGFDGSFVEKEFPKMMRVHNLVRELPAVQKRIAAEEGFFSKVYPKINLLSTSKESYHL